MNYFSNRKDFIEIIQTKINKGNYFISPLRRGRGLLWRILLTQAVNIIEAQMRPNVSANNSANAKFSSLFTQRL